jgi:hypothetical protein
MSRRRTLSAAVALLGALALVASPALGKEGAEAKLDSAVPRDAEPGSTIDVGWSVFSVRGVERQPMYGSPIFIRLVSRDRTTSTEAMGAESPSGSGHYEATIEVPAGGIGEVVVGLVGEACDGNGCRRSDWIFPIIGPTMAFGVVPAAAPTAGTPTAGTPIGTQLLPLVAIGAAFAVVGALGAVVFGRRRTLRADPAGR